MRLFTAKGGDRRKKGEVQTVVIFTHEEEELLVGQSTDNRYPQLVIAAAVLGLSLIVCILIASGTWARQRSTITVTGAATKQLRSDLAVWNCGFTRRSADRSEALALLKKDLQAVMDFLQAKGIPQSDLTVQPANIGILYKTDQNGRETNEVLSYIASQAVKVRSRNVDRVTTAFRSTGELLDKGVELQAAPPLYFYTGLDALKVEMLAAATKNARLRAEKIAENGGGRIGPLRSANMGVFQITPVDSNEVSDYGINDPSSLDKKITAVVNAVFYIR